MVVLVVIAFLLAWRLDPYRSRIREFEAELAARAPLPDDDLISLHFSADDIPPTVPTTVRRIFADSLGCQPEKLRPDDDLILAWGDLDVFEVVKTLETAFGIAVKDDECGRVPATIRAVSRFVAGMIPPVDP